MRTRKNHGRVPFVDALAARGDRPALVGEDGAVTYAELAARVADRAADYGGGRRVVAIAGGNTAETVVSHLAALHGGHVSWLLPDGDAPGTARLLERFTPDVVVVVDQGGVATIDRRPGDPAGPLHPELAMLLGTSGSTGAPRLVRLSHENIAANAAAIAGYLDLGPADRGVTALPVHYCYGLSVLHSHLHAGAAVVLTARSVTDPAFWDLVRAHRVTGIPGVPHTFDLLDRVGFEGMDLPDLRYLTQAGGRMPPCQVLRYAHLGARAGWDLLVMYGQTEATARMAYLPPELAAAHPGAIGVPIPGGAIEIRPHPDADAPGVGEIVYRGPNVMLGYASRRGDLAAGRVVHELRTGDLGRRGPTGLVEVVGRCARTAKLFGLRIDLEHLEAVLAEEGVRAAVAGTDRGLAVHTEQVRDPIALAARVAALARVPSTAVAVTADAPMPRLPSGKPDYPAIAAGVAGGRPPRPRTGPAPAPGAAHEAVLAAFRDALGRERVAPEDTFTGLGGDSLSYVEMSVALEEILGHLPAGWQDMTVAALAGAAAERAPARRMARMETNVVLRAAAVVAVVASHMTAFVPAGGAHLLLGLAGFNAARFLVAAMRAPGRAARALATIARIAVPTSAWIGLQMLLVGGYSVGALLLVNNYTGDPARTERRWEYWFLEALVFLLAMTALLFLVPAVRRWERARPFGFALALLGIALLPRVGIVPDGDDENLFFRPHAVAWIFLLGWAAHRATTSGRRALVSAIVLATVPGFFGQPEREAIVAAGLLALLWLPAITVPRAVVRPVAQVAAASMAIYLTHWQVWPLVTPHLGFPAGLAVTVLIGVLAWRLADGAAGHTARALRRRRESAGRATKARPVPGHDPSGLPTAAAPAAAVRPRPAAAG